MKPELVFVRAPMRISFLGGGSDLPLYVEGSGRSGCVLSATIDRWVYLATKLRRDHQLVVHYQQIEYCQQINELKNNYVREALQYVAWDLGQDGGIEIVSMSDARLARSSLGGSSAFLVALLRALYGLRGHCLTVGDLAEEAFQLETGPLGKLIGRQDHYAAAYGNLRRLDFLPGGKVLEKVMPRPADQYLSDRLLLLSSDIEHHGDMVFEDVHREENRDRNLKLYGILADLACRGCAYLGAAEWDRAFALIGDSWIAKRGTSTFISSPQIDAMHDAVVAAGARCGKVCGSGGGGEMLFWCPDGKENVLGRLNGKYRETKFRFTDCGVETLLEV